VTTDFLIFSCDLFDQSKLDDVESNNGHNYTRSLGVSLLDAMDDGIPLEFKKLIISQWKEIIQINNQIPYKKLFRNLLIVPPQGKLDKHIHNTLTRQTLTLGYRYQVSNSNSQSRMILGKDDSRVINYEGDKFALVIHDNDYHMVPPNDEWIFYWTTDYIERFNIDDYNLGDFNLCREIKL
jgi:hypothetical protein